MDQAKEGNSPRVMRNVFFGVLSQFIGGGIFFLTTVLIARHLRPESYGSFVFVLAIITVIHLAADFGFTQILVREITRNKKNLDNILGSVIPLVTIFAVVAFVIVILITQLFSLSLPEATAMQIFAASFVFVFHSAVFSAVPRAFEEMGFNALAMVAGRILLLLLVIYALKNDAGIEGMSLCYLMERIFQWFILYVLVKKRYSQYKLKIDIDYWRYMIKEGIPLGVAMVLKRVTWHVDIFVLAALSTAASVGFFSAAYRIIHLINVIPFTLSVPLYPLFSRMALVSRDKLFELYTRVLKVFVLIGLPLSVCFFILGRQIMVIMFGEAYVLAGDVLMMMGPLILLLFLNGLYVHIFTALNKQREFMKVIGIAVVTNIVLDLALIPFFDVQGAVMATLFSELILYIAGAFLLTKLGLELAYRTLFFRPCIAVFIPSFLLLWANMFPSLMNIILAVVGFALVYLLTCYFLLERDEVNAMKKLIVGKRQIAVENS